MNLRTFGSLKMEDKASFTKPPAEPEQPSIKRNVARSFLMRESGMKFKSNTIATELQWAAEDKMVEKGLVEQRCQLPDVSRSTFLMVFSPDGTKVASTHGNHNVYVTDLTSGKNVKTLTGHPRTPWCIAFHPSSNQILASGCLGGQVRVWDLSGGSEIWMAESQTVIASLAFHPIDRMLVIASYNELHFWDWSQPEPFARCFTSNEKEKVRYVAFDALGHKLITGVSNAPARPTSQWDRVAAPQPPPPSRDLDSERRITICYRYMVEQYEQLVERYFDLSRVRNTLTMDRGTDPMEFEGDESSDSHSSAPNVPRSSRPPHTNNPRTGMDPFAGPSTSRLSSGTDEASASHSSTHFLTPPEPCVERPNPPGFPLLGTSSSDTSLDNGTSAGGNEAPRRTIRFDITIPSFFNLRSRSSSVPSTTPLATASQTSIRPRPMMRHSLSPDQGFRIHPLPGRQGDSARQEMPSLTSPSLWANRNNPSEGTGTSTEVNDSENEDQGFSEEPQSESQSDDVPRATTSRQSANTNRIPPRNPRNSESSPRRPSDAVTVSQLRFKFHRLQSAYENRNANQSSSSHAFSPEQNSARVREQRHISAYLDRLYEQMMERRGEGEVPPRVSPQPGPQGSQLFTSRRSAFQPRTPTRDTSQRPSTSSSSLETEISRLQNVISSQSLERRMFTQALMNLEDIMRRPEPRSRRMTARRVTVQPRSTTTSPATPATAAATSTTPPATSDIISGVRFGIQQLSRHIDNIQRLCRARFEILQLQQIRRMWEDLQSQIYALHGAVRDEEEEQPPQPTTSQAPPPPPAPAPVAPSTPTTTDSTVTSTDLLTDDDSDTTSSYGEFHWRLRRTPQTQNRPRPTQRWTLNLARQRTMWLARVNSKLRRIRMMSEHRRQYRQSSTSTQEGRGGAGETSTGTSDEPVGPGRGTKRKSRDSHPLFRPRPSTSSSSAQPQASTSATASTSSASTSALSSLISIMRGLINQLETMDQRSRHANPQRNIRTSRFTRQREERRMRNLWDTESSHESSRDDQSEGDSSQRSTPEGVDGGDPELNRDSLRIRARQVLLLMVESLMQFFDNDTEYSALRSASSNEALNERIQNLYTLLQLALHLTDLLLAQLINSRREMDALRSGREGYVPSRRAARVSWRNFLRRNMRNSLNTGSSPSPATNTANASATASASASTPQAQNVLTPTPSRTIPPYRSNVCMYLPHRPVPIVRVNDLPAPPPEAAPTPRFRPHSPPPMVPSPMFVPARFLHPGRYGGYPPEESTSEDSSPQDRSSDFYFIRDTPVSPHHRIQAWDFSKYNLPDLGKSYKNIVVGECKIHNDASVDVSKDGRLIVTLLPSGRLSMTTLLGIYSLEWDTLGQLLYTTSFEQSIVSVSLSPTSRHLVVGLASRRVALISSDRHTNAQVFRLEGASPGRKAPLGARGRLVHLRDLELGRHPMTLMSINCIRWAPNPGQGLVYGTNTGQLKVLR